MYAHIVSFAFLGCFGDMGEVPWESGQTGHPFPRKRSAVRVASAVLGSFRWSLSSRPSPLVLQTADSQLPI